MLDWEKTISNALEVQHELHLWREPTPRANAAASSIHVKNHSLISFASNDYLGISSHQGLIDGARLWAEKWGFGSGGSRLLGGDLNCFHDLESRIATQKKSQSAVLFGSGYQANLGLIQSLSQCGFTFYVDRLAHASIWDGLAMTKAKLHRFRHNDIDHLKELLNKKPNELNVIVSEGIFSMDGDHSPIAQLSDLASNHNSLLWIDEAHSDGILGTQGEGALSSIPRQNFHIQTLTFGKAYGTHGAAICGATEVIHLIWQFARSWIYSTSPGPWWAGSINAALNIAQNEPWRRKKALENTQLLQNLLIKHAFIQETNQSCITPILIGKSEDARLIQMHLKEEGIWTPAIRPPTVPLDSARLRINTCEFHLQEDIELFVNKLIELRNQHADFFIK